MEKKAKLDILEIAAEGPVAETRQDEAIVENGGSEGSSGEQAGGDFSSKVIAWLRKPLFWIISISVAFLGLTAGILVGFYQSRDGGTPAVQGRQAVTGTLSPETKQSTLFEGMV